MGRGTASKKTAEPRFQNRSDNCHIAQLRTTMIGIQRVYKPVKRTDEQRFLVERLWPRGIKKAALHMTDWLKDVAPSDALRRWFNHDPAKWEEFQRCYRDELDGKPEAWRPLIKAAENGDVTLLFSTHDVEHNNAVVLKAYLDGRLKRRKRPAAHGRMQLDSPNQA